MTDETATPDPDMATAPSTKACLHELIVPLRVDNEEGSWIHWCSTCGAISSESEDVSNPKGPWFFPGELSEMDVERINRAARGE